MLAGRKSKPAAVIEAEGKTHLTKDQLEERKEAEEKLKPKNDKIKCPTWLDKDAKKEWKRVVKDLIALNLMSNLDSVALAVYCDAYSNYLKASKAIQENGTTIEYTNATGNTNTVVSPHVQVQTKYAEVIRKQSSELGLTISSRLRLIVPKKDENNNKFSEFTR
ncbi:hypothetical protein CHR37_06410 [Bacillus velezensis]|nr:hypothetical protein CHR37_06410 [Bacillus velezensis]